PNPAVNQPQLPFDSPARTSAQPLAQAAVHTIDEVPIPGVNVAVAEPSTPSDDFSFTIAIGRTAKRRDDDLQMFIDVSRPAASRNLAAQPPVGAAIAPTPLQHSGLYPVASIDDRRLSGLIDASCLLFACGGFLALFGSLGGHFALSKL